MDRERIRTDGGLEKSTDFRTATPTDLEGEVAIVAGGTDGIGKATASRLAELGATLVLVGSTPTRGRAAVEELTGASDNDAIEYRQADFSRMAEVRDVAEEFRAAYDRLDGLVLSAGIVPSRQEMTPEGIERSFAINYLSRFLLTNLLVDMLRDSAPARVVNVAAAGQNPVDELDLDDLAGDRLFNDPAGTDYFARGQGALNQAQVANDLFSLELADRLAGDGVGVTVVNPGAVDTEIRLKADETWRETDEMIRSEYGVVPPEQVAATIVPLASTTEPGVVNGRFFQTGREEVAVQEGAKDRQLRRQLWDRSAELSRHWEND